MLARTGGKVRKDGDYYASYRDNNNSNSGVDDNYDIGDCSAHDCTHNSEQE